MFVIEIKGKIIKECNTLEEAQKFVEQNIKEKAEIYDNKGRLVCFYN